MKVLILTNQNELGFVSSVAQKHSHRADFVISLVLASGYDVGISYMYQHKVPAQHIQKYNWFNFHPAPLPEYKGRNLCYHAIMNGETEFGASLHYMDENFDTGDIIKVRKFDILPWMNAEDVSELAQTTSQALFQEYLPRIAMGEEFEHTSNNGGRYYKKHEISDFIKLPTDMQREIRAITYKKFYPVTDIGGVAYKIVRGD